MKLNNALYSSREQHVEWNENSIPKKKSSLFGGKIGIGMALIISTAALSFTAYSKTDKVDFTTAEAFEEQYDYDIDSTTFGYLEQLDGIQATIDTIHNTHDENELENLYKQLNDKAHVLEGVAIDLAHHKIAQATETNEDDVKIGMDYMVSPTWFIEVQQDDNSFCIVGNKIDQNTTEYLDSIAALQSWKRNDSYNITKGAEFTERCEKTIDAIATMASHNLKYEDDKLVSHDIEEEEQESNSK